MNILRMIINIVNSPIYQLGEFYNSKNRINNMGEALEEYIKDAVCGVIEEQDIKKRIEAHSKTFSYLGNTKNPPDAIIRNGDAIEVKKIEAKGSQLALNSSYPKAKLYSNSSMITKACRECERWDVKDIFYAVGVVNKKILKNLCFVYGEDYAADKEVYVRIKNTIADGVKSIPDVEFSDTKELGRVNRVDPLGITNLRIRGMWHICNPLKTFSYVYSEPENSTFSLMAIINNNKYNSFDESDIKEIEELSNEKEGLKIEEVKIKNPNNPAKLKDVKLIIYTHKVGGNK